MTPSLIPENPKRRIHEQIGIYTVWYDPLAHMPWGLYRIYRGEKYVGAQLSVPCLSDCQWFEAQERSQIRYAKPKEKTPYGYTSMTKAFHKKRAQEKELQATVELMVAETLEKMAA